MTEIPVHGYHCLCTGCRPLEESERVEAWRLEVLLEAGYPITIADRLARTPDVDLHEAAGLVEKGCKPLTAALILL